MATLLGHWKLNDNAAGVAVVDSSANALNGVAARNTNLTYATGKIGGGYQANGSSDKITLPTSALLDFGNGTTDAPFSICCWVNLLSAVYHPLLMRAASSSEMQYILRVNSSYQLGLFLSDADSSKQQGRLSANSAVPAATWAHVAATYDGSGGTNANLGINLYVNGVNVNNSLYATGSYTAMEDRAAVPIIGYHYQPYWGNFIMDDLCVYSGVLTVGQIKRKYAGGVGTEGELTELYAENSGPLWPMFR